MSTFKPTHKHLPTGKLCRVMHTTGNRAFCDFGDGMPDPFTAVNPNELMEHPQPSEMAQFLDAEHARRNQPRAAVAGEPLVHEVEWAASQMASSNIFSPKHQRAATIARDLIGAVRAAGNMTSREPDSALVSMVWDLRNQRDMLATELRAAHRETGWHLTNESADLINDLRPLIGE
jgi:hypothetical protein